MIDLNRAALPNTVDAVLACLAKNCRVLPSTSDHRVAQRQFPGEWDYRSAVDEMHRIEGYARELR